MRVVETVLVVCVAAGLLSIMFADRRARTASGFFGGAAGLALLSHVVWEGHRWQLWAVYVLAAVLVLLAFRRYGAAEGARPGPVLRVVLLIGVMGVLAASTALAVALPVASLPAPPGPYPVGTQSFYFVDGDREEFYPPGEGEPRSFMAQVWYPAAVAAGERAPWIDEAHLFGPAIARALSLPAFLFNHIGHIRSNAYIDAPLAEQSAPFPVVLYSHGWTGFRAVNTDQAEALASHGYVVISPDHTYGALMTLFPDGRAVPYYSGAIPSRREVGDEVYFAAIQALVDMFADDLRFLMDQVERWNTGTDPSAFAGRLDLDRIGLFGHSTGGGAAIETAATDPRVKAVLGMDVWALPVSDDLLEQPKSVPALLMDSEVWSSDENSERLERLWASLEGPAYRMTIAGTQHYDFTLLPLASPLAPRIGLKGPLEGRRVVEIIDHYLVAFFDSHLRAIDTPPLIEYGPAFPEVSFVEKPGSPSA